MVLINLNDFNLVGPVKSHSRTLKKQSLKLLVIIFTKSWEKGVVPEDWKRVNIGKGGYEEL